MQKRPVVHVPLLLAVAVLSLALADTVDHVEHGACNLASGEMAALCSLEQPVDTDRSLALGSWTSNDADFRTLFVRVSLENSTHVRFERHGSRSSEVTGQYSVVQFATTASKVLHVAKITSNPQMHTAPINPQLSDTELNRTFPFVTYTCSEVGTYMHGYNEDVRWDSGSITFRRGRDTGSLVNSVQRFTCSDCVVHTESSFYESPFHHPEGGFIEFFADIPGAPVDLSRTLLFHSYSIVVGTTGEYPGNFLFVADPTNATTVHLRRAAAHGSMHSVLSSIAFTDATTVQHHRLTISSSTRIACKTLSTPVPAQSSAPLFTSVRAFSGATSQITCCPYAGDTWEKMALRLYLYSCSATSGLCSQLCVQTGSESYTTPIDVAVQVVSFPVVTSAPTAAPTAATGAPSPAPVTSTTVSTATSSRLTTQSPTVPPRGTAMTTRETIKESGSESDGSSVAIALPLVVVLLILIALGAVLFRRRRRRRTLTEGSQAASRTPSGDTSQQIPPNQYGTVELRDQYGLDAARKYAPHPSPPLHVDPNSAAYAPGL